MVDEDWKNEIINAKKIRRNKLHFVTYPKKIKVTSSNIAPSDITIQLPSLECLSRKFLPKNLVPEAKLDLHGFYKKDAYKEFINFIEYASNNSFRTLLIITGKGNPILSTGVIRENLHLWINEPLLRSKIGSYYYAPEKYGGSGAFIIFLKKGI
ncbi:MAG: Smr/MutS family protein [Alphaproteobacteria bacterium]